MFANNRTSIKELYRAPQVISVSSDGNKVTFENKVVSIGDVTSQTEVEPGVKLKVEGNTTINGTINTNEIVIGSDYRLKTNIKPLDNTFVVDHLRPVEYNKNNCDKKEIGFIAHELQNVYPDFVTGSKDSEAMQNVNYNNLIGILVNEIQMLKKRVNELELK